MANINPNSKTQPNRVLIGIPIYNEEELLAQTLNTLKGVCEENDLIDILAYNDGSTDGSIDILYQRKEEFFGEKLIITSHRKSEGYGKTVFDILRYGCTNNDRYEFVITMDADLQHKPETIELILDMFKRHNYIDIVSCSRYLSKELVELAEYVPYDRYLINMNITNLINHLFHYNLTDSFCGYKGYRVCRVETLFKFKETGYSSPLEFWVNASYHGLFVQEVPTYLIYLRNRISRGNQLPWEQRLQNYLSALISYSWDKKQKEYIKQISDQIFTFIGELLKKHSEQGKILPYVEFWEKYKPQEQAIYQNPLESTLSN